MNNHKTIVEAILNHKNINVNVQNDDTILLYIFLMEAFLLLIYLTPLHIACINNFYEIVEILATFYMTNVNIKIGEYDENPHIKILIMINYVKSMIKLSPLHASIRLGHIESVKSLLKSKRIDINSKMTGDMILFLF